MDEWKQQFEGRYGRQAIIDAFHKEFGLLLTQIEVDHCLWFIEKINELRAEMVENLEHVPTPAGVSKRYNAVQRLILIYKNYENS